jgi:hypothetical protein
MNDIHQAAQDGNLEKVTALLKENPGCVSATDEEGRTPLHVAALFRRVEVIKLLLASNADVNAKDNDGHTPLQTFADQLRRRLRIAVIASLGLAIVLTLSGIQIIYRFGMKGSTWLVHPGAMLAVLFALIPSFGYSSEAYDWSTMLSGAANNQKSSWQQRFGRVAILGNALVLAMGIAFLVFCNRRFPPESAAGTTTFSQWGLRFERPASWLELERQKEDMESRIRANNPSGPGEVLGSLLGLGPDKAPQNLEHWTVFSIARSGAELMVSIERRAPYQTTEWAIEARKKQFTSDGSKSIRSAQILTIQNRPAVELEVDDGVTEAHDIHVLFRTHWIGFSLISPIAQAEQSREAFQQLVRTCAFDE